MIPFGRFPSFWFVLIGDVFSPSSSVYIGISLLEKESSLLEKESSFPKREIPEIIRMVIKYTVHSISPQLVRNTGHLAL